MSIRLKIILVVLPLVITTLLFTGVSSYFSARNGINRIAREFLGFKALELENFATSQWRLLVDNNFTERPEYIRATKQAVEDYAGSLVRSETEIIIASDPDGNLALQTGEITIDESEQSALLKLIEAQSRDMSTIRLGGRDRVVKGFLFEPFDWYIFITEERETFYRAVNQITTQALVILSASILVAVIMLLIFARYLTRPLSTVAGTIRDIITYSDLSERVLVEYHDETGQLAHTFNIMVGELEKAYNQIKSFAFKAVLAQKREKKIRNIFQKYVPRDVIDQVFENPEGMLVEENRVLSVLFSDIRSFTTISESMMPDDLVNSLNRYFSVMVDIVMDRNGVVDKYIGDAIMAFFGAPVKHDDDALSSVYAGIEMLDALDEFNRHQQELDKPPFNIGVGINYGVVTVGNIGTEKKMDYTVIGDMVNLASRCEGLTKNYFPTNEWPLIITESLHSRVKDKVPCRLLDRVAVKGKTKGVAIYTARKELDSREERAWTAHQHALDLYYDKKFKEAADYLKEVKSLFPKDFIAEMFTERCEKYMKAPPAENWDGVEIMKEK